MEERSQYYYDLEEIINLCDVVMTLMQGVKNSLIQQAIGIEGKNLNRKPWTGFEVSNQDSITNVARRLTVCRDLILQIRKKVYD